MKGYGQYCPVARAAEILGKRWTLPRQQQSNGNGIGDEGDDAHGSTTGRADERQDIIDASDEGGPSRGSTPAWGGSA